MSDVKAKMRDDLIRLAKQGVTPETHSIRWPVRVERTLNPKDQAAKAEGKPRLDLLEPAANEGAARALEFGAITKGYGIQNYRVVPITYRTYLAAVQRHLDALKRGEDMAADSGLSHWDHILANGHVFKGAQEAGTLVDDRGPGPVGPNPVNGSIAPAATVE